VTLRATITIQEAGWAAVQDLGRLGYSGFGVSTGGSADQYSARCANALVANDQARPLVEVTAQQLAFSCDEDCLLAVTGAPCEFTLDRIDAPQWQPLAVTAGVIVRVGSITHGLRVYIAVNGLIDADTVLGSVAPDRGLGVGRWLASGDHVGLASDFGWFEHPHTGIPLVRPSVPIPRFGSPWTIDVVEGPDAEMFERAIGRLTTEEYEVSQQSDAVGLRLTGDTPARAGPQAGELLSRGVAIGSVELPSPGSLLVLMRGRMLTAGYPVLAVATRVAQSRLGQVRPGDTIRFRACSLSEAVTDARREAAALESVARAVGRILEERPVSSRG
jgi:biotin-dependent carboxylase-like uncharacterized protein